MSLDLNNNHLYADLASNGQAAGIIQQLLQMLGHKPAAATLVAPEVAPPKAAALVAPPAAPPLAAVDNGPLTFSQAAALCGIGLEPFEGGRTLSKNDPRIHAALRGGARWTHMTKSEAREYASLEAERLGLTFGTRHEVPVAAAGLPPVAPVAPARGPVQVKAFTRRRPGQAEAAPAVAPAPAASDVSAAIKLIQSIGGKVTF